MPNLRNTPEGPVRRSDTGTVGGAWGASRGTDPITRAMRSAQQQATGTIRSSQAGRGVLRGRAGRSEVRGATGSIALQTALAQADLAQRGELGREKMALEERLQKESLSLQRETALRDREFREKALAQTAEESRLQREFEERQAYMPWALEELRKLGPKRHGAEKEPWKERRDVLQEMLEELGLADLMGEELWS